MVALVMHNEFDRNDNMHLWVRHAQGIRVVQNRFLSEVPKHKTEMVPKIQVGLGDANDPHLLSLNGLFEQNYHRSTDANHPNDRATATVYGYFVWQAIDDLQKDNCFRDNLFYDAVNSTNMVKVRLP